MKTITIKKTITKSKMTFKEFMIFETLSHYNNPLMMFMQKQIAALPYYWLKYLLINKTYKTQTIEVNKDER